MKIKQIVALFAVGGMLAFASCSDDAYNPNEVRTISGLSRADEDIEQKMADFSFGMLGKMAEDAEKHGFENVVYSPLSINSMLSMLALGAEGSTLDGILAATGIDAMDNSVARWAEHYRLILSQMGQLDPSATFRTACGIWTVPTVDLKAGYSEEVSEYFNAGCATAELWAPAGADLVNGWIERNTGGMIKDLYAPGSNPIVLANAMYFAGNWRTPFDKSKTRDADFYNADGSVAKVKMMQGNVEGAISYDYDADCKYLTLRFGNKSFMADFYLTDGSTRASELIPAIRQGMWSSSHSDNEFREVVVRMPRIDLESTQTFNDILGSCGIDHLSNFGKIIDGEWPGMTLLHGVAFKANEDGVKAAAATVSYPWMSDGSTTTYDPQMITLDRPFVFVVYEASSGAILTMGCVNSL